MNTNNIFIYKKVGKSIWAVICRPTLLDSAHIGVCVVIRLNKVIFFTYLSVKLCTH